MYVHQTIEYDNNLPGRIRLFDSPDGKTSVEAHWHEEIELIYVDSGTLFVTINDLEHELNIVNVVPRASEGTLTQTRETPFVFHSSTSQSSDLPAASAKRSSLPFVGSARSA